MKGYYKGSARTLTAGDVVDPNLDANGNLVVNPNTSGAAAAALANGVANPTVPNFGAFLMGFNGTTWDRLMSGQFAGTGNIAGFLNPLPFIQYKATDQALTDGQVGLWQADNAGRIKTNPVGSDLVQTGTAASGAGVTLTLPAVASKFHYITQIVIQRFAAAALTAAAAPIVTTTTNLPGPLAFSSPADAAAQGVVSEQVIQLPGSGLKSSVVNTNTTIVLPATPNVIWRATAYYYAAS